MILYRSYLTWLPARYIWLAIETPAAHFNTAISAAAYSQMQSLIFLVLIMMIFRWVVEGYAKVWKREWEVEGCVDVWYRIVQYKRSLVNLDWDRFGLKYLLYFDEKALFPFCAITQYFHFSTKAATPY